MTFETLAAFALQSTAVAGAAVLLERVLPKHDAAGRSTLWWFAMASSVAIPLLPALFVGGDSARAADSVVFSVEALGRSASPEMRAGVVWAVAAGGILLAVWRLAGLWRLRRYVLESTPVAPHPELAGEIAALEKRIGARADYRVSPTVEGPLVCGVREPVILLPAGFAEMPSELRLAILAHELAHVRRRDWLKLLAEEGLRCAIWFTPAVHLILRKLRVLREMAADSVAIEVTHDRHSYLNALVDIARRPVRADALVAPLFLEPRPLKQRVAALLEERPMSETRRIVALLAVVLLLPLAGRWARDAFPARLQAAQSDVYRVGDGVKAPKLLTKVDPELTDEARAAKVDDTVILSVEVHPDGRLYNIQVKKSLGMGLDENAIAAVEQWTFEPGTKDGNPVTVAATIEVNFKVK